MRLQRYDQNALELKLDSALTPEGYIQGDAITTRAGIFLYRNDDGSIRRELRHPREVFKAKSLTTMRSQPIVDTHAGGMVNAENAKDRQIGMTGENVRVDGTDVVCPVKITTQDGVESVKNGRTQLSWGYVADMVEAEPGALYDGEPYDWEQTNIAYNHLAIVDLARAGKDATLRLDGMQVDESEALETVLKGQNRFDGATNMKKIIIDGVEYEVPPQVAVAYEKATARADAAETTAKTAADEAKKDKKTAEEAKGKMDQAIEDGKKAVEEAKKNFDTSVTERVDLILVAEDRLDAETLKGLEKMDNQAIRLAVIKAANPTFDAKDKSADYIRSRFDAILESGNEDGMAGQRRAMHGDTKTREDAQAADPEKAREHAQKRMDSAPADYLKRKMDERKARGR